jgi:hypothetical protein
MKIQILLTTALLAVAAIPAHSTFQLEGVDDAELLTSSGFPYNRNTDDETASDLEPVTTEKSKKTVRFQEPLPQRNKAYHPSTIHDGAFAYSPTDSGIPHLKVEPYKPIKQSPMVQAEEYPSVQAQEEYPSVQEQNDFAKGRIIDPIVWARTFKLLHGYNPPGINDRYIETLEQLQSSNSLTHEHLPHICHPILDSKDD